MTKSTKPKAKKAAAGKSRARPSRCSPFWDPCRSFHPEMMKSTGWQAHSIRGFLAGSLKKKGHAVSSQVDAGGVRRYRLAAQAEA